MLAPTHSLFGIFLTLTLLAVFGIQESLHWSILLCAVIGSLAPDIDHPKALIGKLFFFISKPLDKKFGHRTITHSLIGWVVATTFFIILVLMGGIACYLLKLNLVNLALAKRWISAFSIGYLSHIVLDMFNPRGSQLFWPNPGRDVIFSSKFRIKSGSKPEVIVFLLLAILTVLSFPLSKYGAATSLRWLLATPEAAIEEVKASKTRVFVTFEGLLNATHESLNGQAEVLDVKNKRLVILFNGTVYTLSDELTADITAKQVRVTKSNEKILTEHDIFDAQNREFLLSKIPENTLISGTIQLPKDLKVELTQNSESNANFKTIRQVGEQLQLTFATKKQIEKLSWDEAFQLMKKQDEVQLNKLASTLKHLNYELQHLDDTQGYTTLGQSVLMTEIEKQANEDKKETLQAQIEETKLAIDSLHLKMKKREFLFSGDVTLRHCSTAYGG